MTIYKSIKTPTKGYKGVSNRKSVGFKGILLALYLIFFTQLFLLG